MNPQSAFDRSAEDYARHRPSPPDELVPLLTRFASCTEAPSVVDIGCGTGLSTRIWLGHARQLVGLDPSAAMLTQARRDYPGVQWLLGQAAATGIPAASTDIVVIAQALHWMEPSATLREVARILRPGGVFAAVDTRYPPAIAPDLDVAFEDFLMRAAHAFDSGAPRWSKNGHLRRMRECGLFRHAREVQLHKIERGDARRFVRFAQTAVDLPQLRELGVSEEQIGLTALRAVAERCIGERETDWVFGYRVRLAVK